MSEKENFDAAIEKYKQALKLLPSPETEWEAATWILVALGDAFFMKKDCMQARLFLQRATNCPNGLGNLFVHLRLGQTQYELGYEILAKDELARAYMGGGRKIFEKTPSISSS